MPKIKDELQDFASFIQAIRKFFDARDVTEVHTPIAHPTVIPDRHIEPMQLQQNKYFLHTSPELAMKTLLCQGSKDIYQIAHVFRAHESGDWHQEEFLMLEWYRTGFDLDTLLNETTALLWALGWQYPPKRWTYQSAFSELCALDIEGDIDYFHAYAKNRGLSAPKMDHPTWMHFLQSTCLEPELAKYPTVYVTGFPAHEASLARINADTGLSERAELYLHGIECANGFLELQDSIEQRNRFSATLVARAKENKSPLPMPEAFLNKLPSLPDCSGIAVGVERLYSVIRKKDKLTQPGNPMFHVEH